MTTTAGRSEPVTPGCSRLFDLTTPDGGAGESGEAPGAGRMCSIVDSSSGACSTTTQRILDATGWIPGRGASVDRAPPSKADPEAVHREPRDPPHPLDGRNGARDRRADLGKPAFPRILGRPGATFWTSRSGRPRASLPRRRPRVLSDDQAVAAPRQRQTHPSWRVPTSTHVYPPPHPIAGGPQRSTRLPARSRRAGSGQCTSSRPHRWGCDGRPDRGLPRLSERTLLLGAAPRCGESPDSCSLGYSLRTGVACRRRHGI